MNAVQKAVSIVLVIAFVGALPGVYRYTEVGLQSSSSGSSNPGPQLVEVEPPPPPEPGELPETDFQLKHLNAREKRRIRWKLAIDINTADKKRLQDLHRVGEATAEKIINHREENGPFRNLADIRNVSGIGPATIEGWQGEVRIGDKLIE